MDGSTKPTTDAKDTGVELQHRIDLAISERMAHDEHRYDELRAALSALEGRVQALSDMLANQPLNAAGGIDLLFSEELRTVRFLQPYRGKLTQEQFFEKGSEAEFPAYIAEQLIENKRAEAV